MRAAVVKKFDFKLELIKENFNDHIATNTAAAIAAVTADIQTSKKSKMEENNIISEISFEIINISFCFACFPKK